MLGCLLYLVLFAIVAVIVLLVFEQVMALIGIPIAGQVVTLLRLLIGLLVLIYFLDCLLGTGLIPWRPWPGPRV